MTFKGPWSEDEVHRFLEQTRVPLRLACNGASGFPVLAALWFVPRGHHLWCATQRSARIVSRLERDPRCAFEVARDEGGYCGVRGQGVVTLHDDRGESVLRGLIERYLDDPDSGFARWLLARADTETALAVDPRSFLSWDFRERMAG